MILGSFGEKTCGSLVVMVTGELPVIGSKDLLN